MTKTKKISKYLNLRSSFGIIISIKDAQDIELYQARLFCLILIFFHFGFGKRILMVNGIKKIGWFKNSRFRFLNS